MSETGTERIDFPNGRGQRLAARLELPADPAQSCALFAHCFTCSKDAIAATRVSRALTARGLAVLRFDFTGLGGSEGDFANETFSSNVEDLVAAATWLREHHGPPRLLIGHSLGGAAALMAADRVEDARAIATIAAPSDLDHLGDLLRRAAPDLDRRGEATVRLGGRAWPITRAFLEDLASQALEARLRALKGKALLVYHAPGDRIVGIDHARRIFDAAPHPKSFLSLDGADHLLTRRDDAQYVAATLAAWASRYLDERPLSARGSG